MSVIVLKTHLSCDPRNHILGNLCLKSKALKWQLLSINNDELFLLQLKMKYTSEWNCNSSRRERECLWRWMTDIGSIPDRGRLEPAGLSHFL